jgi:hypothetical protein
MNVLVNGNFQTGDFTGWNATTPPLVVTTNGRPVGPTPYYCAEFIAGPTAQSGNLDQTASVLSSTLYYATIWIKRAIGTVTPVNFVAFGNPGSIVYISGGLNPTTPDVWQSYHFTFTTGPSVTSITWFCGTLPVANETHFVDDCWLSTSPVCYPPHTKIRVHNNLTDITSNVEVKDIRPNNHFVINTDNQKIPILKNIVAGPVNRLVEFDIGTFGKDQPSSTLQLTKGHKLLIDDQEIKAGKHPLRKLVKCPPTMVHTLVCPTRQYIYANDQPIVAFGLDEWEKIEDTINHTEL